MHRIDPNSALLVSKISKAMSSAGRFGREENDSIRFYSIRR